MTLSEFIREIWGPSQDPLDIARLVFTTKISEMSGNHNLLYCDSMIIRLEAYSNFSLVAILMIFSLLFDVIWTDNGRLLTVFHTSNNKQSVFITVNTCILVCYVHCQWIYLYWCSTCITWVSLHGWPRTNDQIVLSCFHTRT